MKNYLKAIGMALLSLFFGGLFLEIIYGEISIDKLAFVLSIMALIDLWDIYFIEKDNRKNNTDEY